MTLALSDQSAFDLWIFMILLIAFLAAALGYLIGWLEGRKDRRE